VSEFKTRTQHLSKHRLRKNMKTTSQNRRDSSRHLNPKTPKFEKKDCQTHGRDVSARRLYPSNGNSLPRSTSYVLLSALLAEAVESSEMLRRVENWAVTKVPKYSNASIFSRRHSNVSKRRWVLISRHSVTFKRTWIFWVPQIPYRCVSWVDCRNSLRYNNTFDFTLRFPDDKSRKTPKQT
jgi:hypothetical protein